jgi:SP family general alpha glucoside:H+ symporter-like MFS transporter
MKEEGHVDVNHDDILMNPDLLNEAVDGENREHEMGLWQSVQAHPWACLWAFTMCFTIVSFPVQGYRIEEVRTKGATGHGVV